MNNLPLKEKQLEITQAYLDENNIFYHENFKIKYHTYFKMGGNIKLYIAPKNADHFCNIIIFLRKNSINFKTIGFTTNILLFDDIEYSIVISTKNISNIYFESSDIVEVETGYSLQEFTRVALINSAKGYEGLEGIPGSIGGGIVMNAGAYGATISDNLISVKCISQDNKIIILSKKDCKFGHRDSLFKNQNYLVVSAKFKFIKGNKHNIARRMEKYHIARHSYQEFSYPTLGSLISFDSKGVYYHIFKNDPLYNIVFKTMKLLFKNPITKFIKRKRPDQAIFNYLMWRYLRSRKDIKMRFSQSDKSANVLINDGKSDIIDIVSYIHLLNFITEYSFPIENEIMIEPAYKVHNEIDKRIIALEKRYKDRFAQSNS